jgi:hypothetical protein
MLIPSVVQRSVAMSTTISPVEAAFSSTIDSNVAASMDAARRSNTTLCLMRHAVAVAAAVAFFGFALPAEAASQQGGLTSHSPWLAPVGHRQPRQADIPQNEVLSAWERDQQHGDDELDRKLIICRGC